MMTNSEAIEKIKSTHAEIIVCGKVKKPYFQIRYFDLSDHETHVGYGSYKLEFVFQWLEECFEIIKENTIENDIPLIMPISIEQYAEENTKLKAEIEQFSNELISVRIENELLKKKNELTNYYFEQYAAAIDEIEQLKRLLDQKSELNIEQFKQINNQYQEIEQLKSELEQSVKLPCRVGDIVYAYSTYFGILAYEINSIHICYGISFESIASRNGDMLDSFDFDIEDIGKTIFLTREEAERALNSEVPK